MTCPFGYVDLYYSSNTHVWSFGLGRDVLDPREVKMYLTRIHTFIR